MICKPLDRRSFVAFGACAVASCAMGPSLAFADEMPSTGDRAEETSSKLDQLPDNPTLEEMQRFAESELADMPDPKGMVVSSENASDIDVEMRG